MVVSGLRRYGVVDRNGVTRERQAVAIDDDTALGCCSRRGQVSTLDSAITDCTTTRGRTSEKFRCCGGVIQRGADCDFIARLRDADIDDARRAADDGVDRTSGFERNPARAVPDVTKIAVGCVEC